MKPDHNQLHDNHSFPLTGWYPGGYSGIQQIDSSTRVAIFSMWNDGKGGKLSPYSHGPKVKVSSFDGEGTGLKAMKRINWKEGQDVKMIVEGKKKLWSTSALVKRIKGSKKEIWCALRKSTKYTCTSLMTSSFFYHRIVSCWYELDGQRHFLASYKRHSSVKPLSPTGFYSFVEDWDRSVGAKGHNLCRMAIFKVHIFQLLCHLERNRICFRTFVFRDNRTLALWWPRLPLPKSKTVWTALPSTKP